MPKPIITIKRPKTCKRCLTQYVNKHECKVGETEQERIKRLGQY